ncbi:MAG: thioredoxin [Bacilli bacterium]|nr:thioredoxin [Bacilli bacterium]MBR3230268.1 thioredoxin [Bacilli bacterium]
MVKDVTKDNFEKEVLKSTGLVVCDFNADWCGPCKMLRPIIDEVSETRSEAKFVSINIDNEDELAYKYGVSSIPCLVLFKDGKEIKRSVGLIPREKLEEFIEE